MQIIISPAKKMNVDVDSFAPEGLPVFLAETERLMTTLRGMTPEALQALWRCNDAIARQNVERLAGMDLRRRLTPAILSYEGIQYQYMAPGVFTEEQLQYIRVTGRINRNLQIPEFPGTAAVKIPAPVQTEAAVVSAGMYQRRFLQESAKR